MYLINLLFSFKGRINRLQYWLATVLQVIFCGLAVFIFIVPAFKAWPHMDVISEEQVKQAIEAILPSIAAPSLIILAFSIWMSSAVITKRLHDRNKSIKWLFVSYVLMILGRVFFPFFIVSALYGLWLNVEVGMLPGTKGPNNYDHGPGQDKYLDDVFGQSGNKTAGGMASAMASIDAAARDKRFSPPAAPAPKARPAYQPSPYPPGAAPTGFGRRGLT
jgi:uncharacterized membrane protein YhaH (DUF805 family)